MSLIISISVGFTILVLILDKLVPIIDPDWSTMLSVSAIWVDLDLSIDLNVSVLLLLDVSTVLLDACDFSVLLNVLMLFFLK